MFATVSQIHENDPIKADLNWLEISEFLWRRADLHTRFNVMLALGVEDMQEIRNEVVQRVARGEKIESYCNVELLL